MLIPTKYENLEKNLLVIGSDILAILESRPYDIDGLFAEIQKSKHIGLELLLDCMTFLYMIGFVEAQDHVVYLIKQ